MPGGIDKNAVRRRFGRSLGTYREAADVQRAMAETLLDVFTLATQERQFAEIVELGCGGGLLTDLIAERFDFARLTLIDLVPECGALHRGRPTARFLAGDIETMELPEGDLYLSNAVFQWTADPGRLFGRIAEKLGDGGLLGFATFAPETLREVAALTGGGLAYRTGKELTALLEANGFEVLAAREELLTQEFDSPLDVLKSLKATGVTAVAPAARWTRRKLAEFCEAYTGKFRLENGSCPLTYHPIALVAKKRERK
jgi:malonyl-ACP O-methyltransferase BioC